MIALIDLLDPLADLDTALTCPGRLPGESDLERAARLDAMTDIADDDRHEFTPVVTLPANVTPYTWPGVAA